MPLYIEYDKTDGSVKRVLSADALPQNIAYLAYQEIPEDVEIDISINIKDIMDIIMQSSNKNEVSSSSIPETSKTTTGPIVIEV